VGVESKPFAEHPISSKKVAPRSQKIADRYAEQVACFVPVKNKIRSFFTRVSLQDAVTRLPQWARKKKIALFVERDAPK
jgi:hypothetical protein